MAQLYKDTLPLNANVIVDYNAHERVRFSYPKEYTYWKAVWKSARITVTTFWLAFNYRVAFYSAILLIFYILFYIIDNMTLADISFESFIAVDWNPVIKILLIIFYLFGIPIIVTYILALNKNLFSMIMPKMGFNGAKMLLGSYRKIFKPEDVIDNRAIIPIFSNVYLHYRCHGDFDKYLDKIEIMAIPFKYSKKKRGYKEEAEEYEFSAVFYFSQRPKKGELDVRFI